MLFTIGLRIERLLYLGFALLLICALQVYLTTVATHFNAKGARLIEELVELLQANAPRLQRLYEDEKVPLVPRTEKEKRVATMREKLNLPPARPATIRDGDNYRSELEKLIRSLPDRLSVHSGLEEVMSFDKDPKALIASLQDYQRTQMPDKGVVLGIETPRHLTLQYGSSDFRFSAQPLAIGLLIALYPLVFVWLGSFLITRQRELIAVRKLRDHKEAFPHILNFFTIDFSGFRSFIGWPVKVKEARMNVLAARVCTTLVRCVFLFLAVTPLVLGLGYSSMQLSLLLALPFYVDMMVFFSFIVLAFLAISLIGQEIILLHGKTFYE